MRESITDLKKNIEFNKERWGDEENWLAKDSYGYRWGGGVQQTVAARSQFADTYLRPMLGERYDHEMLELSPGAGRFTAELIRYAKSLDLLDMNQACLDICKERFKYFPMDINYYLNDGQSCEILGAKSYSFIACYDSMVHMHPEVISGYVNQLKERLAPQGLMWLDHSGKGSREIGHRTNMDDRQMREIGESANLELIDQTFRNDHDCITVFKKPA
jgi:hypothetical protein